MVPHTCRSNLAIYFQIFLLWLDSWREQEDPLLLCAFVSRSEGEGAAAAASRLSEFSWPTGDIFLR